uniref:Eukaryotic translation initiation factor 3 subunit G n=1 Tax=Arcella intermedia TaxID=1963864 RepID=A0A6B2LDC2_9EUKA|eukprot:TRINITY_DN943_c0_g1_i1.p1 TRINITY_DN943_c0_g1~~TRINITY_DN943_c0_g1_i1.p1  ORF type:complete len:279 (+),score=66.72 TRINITY_DN943_c0_g1_i1:24-839(+)
MIEGDQTKWGDITDSDNEGDQQEAVQDSNDLASGNIKKVTEVITKNGKRIKVTKTIRVYKRLVKTNKNVEDRKKRWVKFGKCAGVEGPEPGVTGVAEAVPFILGEEERKEKKRLAQEKREEEEMKRFISSIKGAQPGAAAASVTSPGVWKRREQPARSAPASLNPANQPARTPGAYVPPHKLRSQEEEATTLRVTNLSEDTSEDDLRALFRPFGDISRVFLAMDKEKMKSKGFAFINFRSRDSAQKAMNDLNGKGWNYLILSIEWAKPSSK